MKREGNKLNQFVIEDIGRMGRGLGEVIILNGFSFLRLLCRLKEVVFYFDKKFLKNLKQIEFKNYF